MYRLRSRKPDRSRGRIFEGRNQPEESWQKLNEQNRAVVASVMASVISTERFAAMGVAPSPLNPRVVAYYVGLDAAERARKADADKTGPEVAESRTPALLGCWINGKLRYQTRDHDELRAYAARHMDGARNFGHNVWVAPVGSFVDSKAAADVDRRAMRKVVKALKNG